MLINSKGESLPLDEIEIGDAVSVVFTKRRFSKEKTSSRDVKATEIKILEPIK